MNETESAPAKRSLPIPLVPRLVRDNLERVAEVLERVAPGISQLEAYDLFDGCYFLTDTVLRHWDFVLQKMERGIERSQCATGVADALEMYERALQVIGKAKQVAGLLEPVSPRAVEVLAQQRARLDECASHLSGIKEKATHLSRWLGQEAPPLDPDSIPMKGNPLTGEGFKTPGQVLAELRGTEAEVRGCAVAYHVQITDDVIAYVTNQTGLSETAQVHVLNNLEEYLGEFGDLFRNNPALRLGQESFCFFYDYVFLDRDNGNRFCRLRFVVSDEHAGVGVLTVLFVDDGQAGKTDLS